MANDDKTKPSDKSPREADDNTVENVRERDLLGKSNIDDRQVTLAVAGQARQASKDFDDKLKGDQSGNALLLPPADQLLGMKETTDPAVAAEFSSLLRSHLSVARHGGGADKSVLPGAPADAPATGKADSPKPADVPDAVLQAATAGRHRTELDRKLDESFASGDYATVGQKLLYEHSLEAAKRLGIPTQLLTPQRIQLNYPGYGREGITGSFFPWRMTIEIYRSSNSSMVGSLEHELRHMKRALDYLSIFEANPDLARRLASESAIESVGTGKPILSTIPSTQRGLAMSPEHAETMRTALRDYLKKVPPEKASYGLVAEFMLIRQPGFADMERSLGPAEVRKEFAAQLKHIQQLAAALAKDRETLGKLKDVDSYLKERGEELRSKHGDALGDDPAVRKAFRHMSDDRVGTADSATYWAGSSEEMTARRHGASGELRQLLKEAQEAEKAAKQAAVESANRSWLSPSKWLETLGRVLPGLSPNQELTLTAQRARERYDEARTYITNEIQQTNRLQKVLTELREMDKAADAMRTPHFEAARRTALEYLRHVPAELYEREERAREFGEPSPHGLPDIVKYFQRRGLIGSTALSPDGRAERMSAPTEGVPKLEAGLEINERVREITKTIAAATEAGKPLSEKETRDLCDKAVREVLLPEARQIAKRRGLNPDIITEKNLQLFESLGIAGGSYDTTANTIRLSLSSRDIRSTLEHEISHMHDAIVTTAIGKDQLNKILLSKWLDHAGSGEVLVDGTRRMKLDGSLRQEMRELTRAAMEKFGSAEVSKRQISDWLSNVGVSNDILKQSGNKACLALELWSELGQFRNLTTLNMIPEATLESNNALTEAVAKERARLAKSVEAGKSVENDPYVRRMTDTAVRDMSGRASSEEYRFSSEEIRARRRQAAAELRWLQDFEGDASLRDAAIKDARDRIAYANVSEKMIREFEAAQRLSTTDAASHLTQAKVIASNLLAMSDPNDRGHRTGVQFMCNSGLITRDEARNHNFAPSRPSDGGIDLEDNLLESAAANKAFAKRIAEGQIRSENLTVVKDAATGTTDYVFKKAITVNPRSSEEVTVLALHEKDGEFTATVVDSKGRLLVRNKDECEFALMAVTENPRFEHSKLSPAEKAHFYAVYIETAGHKSELPATNGELSLRPSITLSDAEVTSIRAELAKFGNNPLADKVVAERFARAMSEVTRNWSDLAPDFQRQKELATQIQSAEALIKTQAATAGGVSEAARKQYTEARDAHAAMTSRIEQITKGRAAEMQAAANKFCKENGIPQLRINIVESLNSARASYEPGTGVVNVPRTELLNRAGGIQATNALYHEIAHAQQDALIIRSLADKMPIFDKHGQTNKDTYALLAKAYAEATGRDLTRFDTAEDPVGRKFVDQILKQRKPDGAKEPIVLTDAERAKATEMANSFKAAEPFAAKDKALAESQRVTAAAHEWLKTPPSTNPSQELFRRLAEPDGQRLAEHLFGSADPKRWPDDVRKIFESWKVAAKDSAGLATSWNEGAVRDVLSNRMIERIEAINAARTQNHERYMTSLAEREAHLLGTGIELATRSEYLAAVRASTVTTDGATTESGDAAQLRRRGREVRLLFGDTRNAADFVERLSRSVSNWRDDITAQWERGADQRARMQQALERAQSLHGQPGYEQAQAEHLRAKTEYYSQQAVVHDALAKRQSGLQAEIDKYCGEHGLPKVKLQLAEVSSSLSGYNRGAGMITINPTQLLNRGGMQQLLTELGKQMVHAEQDARVVTSVVQRANATKPPTADDIARIKAAYEKATGSMLSDAFLETVRTSQTQALTEQQLAHADKVAETFKTTRESAIQHENLLRDRHAIATEIASLSQNLSERPATQLLERLNEPGSEALWKHLTGVKTASELPPEHPLRRLMDSYKQAAVAGLRPGDGAKWSEKDAISTLRGTLSTREEAVKTAAQAEAAKYNAAGHVREANALATNVASDARARNADIQRLRPGDGKGLDMEDAEKRIAERRNEQKYLELLGAKMEELFPGRNKASLPTEKVRLAMEALNRDLTHPTGFDRYGQRFMADEARAVATSGKNLTTDTVLSQLAPEATNHAHQLQDPWPPARDLASLAEGRLITESSETGVRLRRETGGQEWTGDKLPTEEDVKKYVEKRLKEVKEELAAREKAGKNITAEERVLLESLEKTHEMLKTDPKAYDSLRPALRNGFGRTRAAAGSAIAVGIIVSAAIGYYIKLKYGDRPPATMPALDLPHA